MAIQKVVVPYEIRINFDEEGGIASRSRTDKILYKEEDGTVLPGSGGTQLSELTEEALATFIGGATAALNTQIAALQSDKAAALAAQATAEGAVTAGEAAQASAEAQRDAATAYASDLAVQLASANLQLQTNATTPLPAEGLKGYAAQKRYAIETGGLEVDGVAFATDRDTQGKLMGAFMMTQVNPSEEFDWKLPGGVFVHLTAKQLQKAAVAIGKFVSLAFVHEAAAVAAIEAGAAHTPNDVDAFFE